MPIGSTLDVLIQQDDLVVLGPPSIIDVAVDIGPPGQMGGQIYAGDFDPNTITSDQFRELYGAPPRPRDVFVRNDSTEFYGSFYQYSEVPGSDQWQIIIDLVDVFSFYLNNNPIALGADTSGNYIATIAGTANQITVSGSGSETAAVTLSLPSTINVDTSGNAATATRLATARTIALAGDVSGSASFDGSGSVSISTTIQPDSVALGTDTTGNYVASVSGTDGVSVTGTGEGAAVTVANTDKGSSQNIFKTISSDSGAVSAASNSASVAITGGTAIGTSIADSVLTITNNGVTALTGTANEVNVSASTGSITLSLPDTVNIDISGNAATVSAVPARVINQKTGSYTLQLADAQNILEFNSASAMILTIPEDSSVNFPAGSYIDIVQTGDAEVEVQGGGVVTLLSKNSETKTSGQYSRVYLYKQSSNTWILTGDLSL